MHSRVDGATTLSEKVRKYVIAVRLLIHDYNIVLNCYILCVVVYLVFSLPTRRYRKLTLLMFLREQPGYNITC